MFSREPSITAAYPQRFFRRTLSSDNIIFIPGREWSGSVFANTGPDRSPFPLLSYLLGSQIYIRCPLRWASKSMKNSKLVGGTT